MRGELREVDSAISNQHSVQSSVREYLEYLDIAEQALQVVKQIREKAQKTEERHAIQLLR